MRNSFELAIAKELKKRRVNFEYETKRIPYTLYYIPDFYLPKYGVYIEAKGNFKPEQRTKMLAVKRDNPKLDIRFVFYADRKLGKKLKYSTWCEKHGFKWSIRTIPEDWL